MGLTPRQFRDRYARGGYAWTMGVSYAIGAHMALFAIRRGIRPNTISSAGALTSILTSAIVVALYPAAPVVAGIVAVVGWQLAYALDCTDGQVARATGQGTPMGPLVDLVNDWISRTSVVTAVLAIAAPAWAQGAGTGAAIAGVWLFGLAYEGWARGYDPRSIGRGHGTLVDLVRHARDYGFQVAALGVGIVIGPPAAWLVLLAIVGLELAFISTRLLSMARR